MVARRLGDEALARPGRGGGRAHATSCPSCWSTCSGSRTSAPTTRTGSPTTRPATRCGCCGVGDRPLRLLRHVAGLDLVELPDAEVCCGFGGTFAVKNADTSTAMLADKMRNVLATGAEVCTAGDSSCLMHIGGGLSRLRAGARTVHLAEILASTRDERRDAPFLGMPDAPARGRPPARGRAVPGGRPRARWPTPSCAATWARPPRTIRAKRAAVVGELPDWEELRAAGQAIKADTMAHLDRYLEQLEAQVTARGGTVHWARDAAEAQPRSWPAWSARTGATEVVKVKSIVTDEIGLNEALAAAGIAAHETDLAELIVQLGHDRPSHILVPAIHRNRAEIREIFLREMADVDPGLTDEPGRAGRGGPAAPAAQVPVRQGRHQRRELRRRRDRHAVRGRVRGQRPDVPDPAGHADHRHGHREGDPVLARPGGVPAAAAALVHRRADEPLHLDVDRGDARATARSSSTWCCWTTAGPRRWPTRSAGQALHCIRCSACLNVCPVYERVGGHAYGSVYPGPIGAVLSPQLTGVEDNAVAAVRVVAVRRLLRRLPGQDRHPVAAGPPARPARRGGAPRPGGCPARRR